VLKFFPAETYGGINVINALASVFGDVMFMPTGGINLSNAEKYLKNKIIAAIGGSWMATEEMISNGDFAAIELKAREAAELVRRIRHEALHS
jgi:2-keto-3-deoxy-6-phosphogluconate aldolase